MTHTIQPLTWTVAQRTVKTKLTETEENIRDILAVCDGMNKLCETLSRLAYVLERKNIEASLTGKGQGVLYESML